MTRRNNRSNPVDYRSLGVVGIVALVGIVVVMLTNTTSQDLTGKATAGSSLDALILERCNDGTLECHTLNKGQTLALPKYHLIWDENNDITFKAKSYTQQVYLSDKLEYELKKKNFSNRRALLLSLNQNSAMVAVVTEYLE